MAVSTATTVLESPINYNIVDTSITCFRDFDCRWQDLDYITGQGKPKSKNDVCCASFPRESWDTDQGKIVFQVTKHCYSKKILSDNTDFNYYK